MLKYYSFRPTVKYEITPCTHKPFKTNFAFFSSSIRISGKNGNFGDKKIKKSNFYKNKKVIKIDDIDANKILVPKEEPHGSKSSFKYFIGHNDDDSIVLLCIKLPQMIGYVKNFDGNKTMSFKIGDNKLLKKYNQIWKRVEKLLKTKFVSELVYGDNDNYIKTKIKIYMMVVQIKIFKAKVYQKQKHHASVYR